MADFRYLFDVFKREPTVAVLESFAYNVESLSKSQPKDVTKSQLIEFFVELGGRPEFYAEILRSESILRIYKLLGTVSKRMGALGLYKELENRGTFKNSLKFHLQWAEEYAKTGDVKGFARVLDLARDRLINEMSVMIIEAGFRDIAQNYPIEVEHLFAAADDTMAIFGGSANTKARRRSSVNFLQKTAPVREKTEYKHLFGGTAKTKIRAEFVDKDGQYGVSPEEFRFAMLKDDIGDDMDLDVTIEESIVRYKRKDSGFVFNGKDVDENQVKATKELVENRMKDNRRRQLSMVDEERSPVESDAEKKARIYSPLVATKDAQRLPLRPENSANKIPETITISSDTKTCDSTIDLTFGTKKDDELAELPGYRVEIDQNKLRKMSSGRRERTTTEETEMSTASSTRTARSGTIGLDVMAENNCLEAHAMFSETVHLRDKTMAVEDEPENSFRSMATAVPNNQTTDFSVLCDPDPTFHVQNQNQLDKPKISSSGLNMVYDEKSPVAEKDEEMQEEKEPPVQQSNFLGKDKDPFNTSPSSFNTPPSYEKFSADCDNSFDESIVSGFSKPSRRNIVTSTPAVGYVDVEEYFGNPKSHEDDKKKQEEAEEPNFAIPAIINKSRLSRRVSVAPSIQPPVAKTVVKPPAEPPRVEDMSLSEQLERRLSLGADDAALKDAISAQLEETGIKNRRRSEVMRGDINPWDTELQMKLMKLVRPPTHMHEFQANCPKIQATKAIEAGGEKFNVQTLLGQGGYAKVYKALNEEKQIVAIKYEVPSCKWEVYICDQMRHRLLKKGDDDSTKIADLCIMQVIDAYIFTNASLLVNDYCEYGTLLEYASNTKDQNWHILCFLLHQMAKIVREVHSVQVIHGDIKPDNFMITRKIDMNWSKADLMDSSSYVIKLIDWGRAIDMATLKGHTFRGRAGTEGFDCPEMIDGRPWTYQADFFSFAASMAVIASGKYSTLSGSALGEYSLFVEIKRRNILRDLIIAITQEFLNIESCSKLPSWDKTIQSFEDVWKEKFDSSAWRTAAAKFNEACDQGMK